MRTWSILGGDSLREWVPTFPHSIDGWLLSCVVVPYEVSSFGGIQFFYFFHVVFAFSSSSLRRFAWSRWWVFAPMFLVRASQSCRSLIYLEIIFLSAVSKVFTGFLMNYSLGIQLSWCHLLNRYFFSIWIVTPSSWKWKYLVYLFPLFARLVALVF